MIVSRFCSKAEARAILNREPLVNETDHFRDGAGGSTSKGFCFVDLAPLEAWLSLKGTVCPEVCMVYDIPDRLLTKSCGKYAGEKRLNPDGSYTIFQRYVHEYCMTRLSMDIAQVLAVIPIEFIAPKYEVEAARDIYEKTRHLKQ